MEANENAKATSFANVEQANAANGVKAKDARGTKPTKQEATQNGSMLLNALANARGVDPAKLVLRANRSIPLVKGDTFEIKEPPHLTSFDKDGAPVYYPAVTIVLNGSEKEISLNAIGMYQLASRNVQIFTEAGEYKTDNNGKPFVYRENGQATNDPFTITEEEAVDEEFAKPKSLNATAAIMCEAFEWFYEGAKYKVLGVAKYSRVARNNAPAFVSKQYKANDCYWNECTVIKAIE